LPLPLAANPIDGVLFSQVYVVVPSVFEVENAIEALVAPLHNTLLGTAFTCADGLTVILTLADEEHPVEVFVPTTVYCTIEIAFELLVRVALTVAPVVELNPNTGLQE
jgi:hypothetical protein